MKELAQLLNEMWDAGVIQNYALFEAMAQMRYTEAVATLDADVLVAVASLNGLMSLPASMSSVSDVVFPQRAMPFA